MSGRQRRLQHHGSGEEQYGSLRRRDGVQKGHNLEPDQEIERKVEQKVNVPVPEISEETVEVVKPRDQETPLERIQEQIVEVTASQIEVKGMITDLMYRLQFASDAELNVGVNADENEEMIGTAVRETLDELDKNHVTENGESETAVQDALDELSKNPETGSDDTAVQDTWDRLHKDHAAENDEIGATQVMGGHRRSCRVDLAGAHTAAAHQATTTNKTGSARSSE